MNELTTATTDRFRESVTPEPNPEVLALAGQLLAHANLRMRRVTPEQARLALACVLAISPLDSSHGQLLAAACRRRNQAKRRRGPRPDPERAARRLLERGQSPTPAAVAAEQRNAQLRRDADYAREARISPLLERDGGLVAGYVRDYQRRTGSGPSWAQVRRHMCWRYSDGDHIIRQLIAAGWLKASREPGSLRPGPRAKGLTW